MKIIFQFYLQPLLAWITGKLAQRLIKRGPLFSGVPFLGKFFAFLGATRALHMIIIADTWKVTPLVVLLTLAGLQTIPHTLFEAANIDGAGPFRRLFHIYLPLLRPIILVILVIRTMELFRVFDIIYIMMTWQINVLSIYTYQLAFNFSQFGKGSAIGFLVGIIIGALAIVYMRFLYTEEVEQ